MRAVIYVRGGDVQSQETRCLADIEYSHHEVVAYARDDPGCSDGWSGALRMIEAGDADYILVSSPDAIPHTKLIRVAGESARSVRRARRVQPW